MSQKSTKLSTVSFKEFEFDQIMGVDATQMSDENIDSLLREMRERRVSAPTRRAEAKKASKKLAPEVSGISIEALMNI